MDKQLWLKMANCIFELNKRSRKEGNNGMQRLADKMQGIVQESGLMLLDPTGEPFSETRTDVEATLTGVAKGPLHITDVLKPIIYIQEDGRNVLLQRGVVLVS